MTNEENIKRLVQLGHVDPNCTECEATYISLQKGEGFPFYPNHKPSSMCESGKHPHCTCDACF